MRSPLSFAFAALLIVPAANAGPATHAAWHWARALVPNATAPAAEQCAVLDAALFAGAAPGLRDVRLLQDGRELAYATDISLDDGSAHGPAAPAGDRALYEVSLVIPAYPSMWPGPESHGDGSPRSDHPPGWFYGHGVLPPHVPVERIRLLDAPQPATEFFSMRAAEASRLPEAETVESTLTPEHPAAAFTVGANLQQAADVLLSVHGDAGVVRSFVLEMRRREICYQPLSASPVTLLFGNAGALPVHYDFAKNFQPKATPLLAAMGPVYANPSFQAAGRPQAGRSTKSRLLVAISACVVLLGVTLRALLRRVR